MNDSIYKLFELLAFDTNVKKFLTVGERCEIHKIISDLHNNKEVKIKGLLKDKLKNARLEIQKKGWKAPDYLISMYEL